MNKQILSFVLFSALILSACSISPSPTTDEPATQTESDNVTEDVSDINITDDSAASPTEAESGIISEPISNALSRVTKKSFGIKAPLQDSTVSPDRFFGYHTGTDFEVTSDELYSDVQIYAVCDGPLALKKYASGYGGVAVQKCNIQNYNITVIYGHLKLESISAQVGKMLNKHELIGILGKGNSTETDNERKHLHFGIHKGSKINLLGYVQNESELNGWIDPITLLE